MSSSVSIVLRPLVTQTCLKIVELSIQHLEGVIPVTIIILIIIITIIIIIIIIILIVLFYSFNVLSQKQVIATHHPAKMEARAQKQTLVLNASVHHSGTV